ncbi:DUF1684 domain-containing protein [Paenarthrobacter sp. DKR-5]|uniref:DUF1684 domain-containing protein n=1 Tax=Paenarthrobacter sp. DKR-5 TaxID=2835535 RepID=UPI001BDCAB0F|nr:DUF1684 domain-containing protein [Paenarthrobacter sp. DKR-5]MBT1003507.1 DUF1684 domain-containing protein [Paenarthrobacter sp. DKR-5]
MTETAPPASLPAADPAAVERWRRFRKHRDAALASDFGWLTLTSLQWLPEQPGPLELVPGLWSTDRKTATLTASAEDGFVFVESGEQVDGTYSAELADEESLNWVRYRSIVVELAVRGGRYAIRTRDAQSPTFTDFEHVPTYEYDPSFVVQASFERYPEPRDIPIGTANPLVEGVHRAAGELVFELKGHHYRLTAEEDKLGGLTVTFHDETNGDTTDEWRKVSTAKPRPDGTVELDFNRAINYPSAFSPYGTCPMPTRNNSLGVRIEAGEKTP